MLGNPNVHPWKKLAVAIVFQDFSATCLNWDPMRKWPVDGQLIQRSSFDFMSYLPAIQWSSTREDLYINGSCIPYSFGAVYRPSLTYSIQYQSKTLRQGVFGLPWLQKNLYTLGSWTARKMNKRLPSGKQTARPWKSTSSLVNTIKMVGFPWRFVSLQEGIWRTPQT